MVAWRSKREMSERVPRKRRATGESEHRCLSFDIKKSWSGARKLQSERNIELGCGFQQRVVIFLRPETGDHDNRGDALFSVGGFYRFVHDAVVNGYHPRRRSHPVTKSKIPVRTRDIDNHAARQGGQTARKELLATSISRKCLRQSTRCER